MIARDPIFDDIFTLEEAAEYVGMPVGTFTDQVYRYGRIEGALKAKLLLFSRAQLDAFKTQPRLKRGGRRAHSLREG